MKKYVSVFVALCLLLSILPTLPLFAVQEDYMLQDFSLYDDLSPADQSMASYAPPVTLLTTEYRQSGNALRAEWKASGGLRAGVHTFRPSDDWVKKAFANKADEYAYFRLYIANPESHSLHLTVRLFEGESNRAYFRPSQATVSDKNGNKISCTTTDAAAHGTGSTLVLPSGFVGFVAYPLSIAATNGSGSGRVPISDFADVHTIELDIRLPQNTSGSYYVLDDLCFTDAVSGQIEPDESEEVFTPSIKTDALLMLQDFEKPTELNVFDQSHAMYAPPILSSTTEHAEEGNALKARWASQGSLRIGVHTYRPDGAWVREGFAKNASAYTYLRLWIANPTFSSLHLTVRMFEGASNKAHFVATMASLYRKDGTQLTVEGGNAGAFGEDSSMVIPSGFEGWVSYVLSCDATQGSGSGRRPISNFADVHTLDIDVRRTEAETQSDYYVLDGICLTTSPTGTLRSVDEEIDYEIPEIDTTYDGIQNVIMIIGDGMGPVQLEAARRTLKGALPMDAFPVIGSFCTDNVLGELTDSGAGGTALSTGYKTLNGMIARDRYGNALPTLLEYFASRGKATGLVTTSYLADATPAAFGSHVMNRSSYTAIIKAYYENNIQVLMGGGTDEFSAKIIDPSTKESKSLLEYAKTQGYTVARASSQMNAVKEGKLLGVFAPHYMSYENSRPSSQPSLGAMTEKALSLLDDDSDGLFLMVEAGNIDHAAHANQLNETIADTIALCQAVEQALAFLESHPDTLIIVSADHETGGLVERNGSFVFTTSDHSRADVPYFVIGKGAEYFKDVKENTDIPKALKQAVDELDPTYKPTVIPTLSAAWFEEGKIEQTASDAYTVKSKSYSVFVSQRPTHTDNTDIRILFAADTQTLQANGNQPLYLIISFADYDGKTIASQAFCLFEELPVASSALSGSDTYTAVKDCALFSHVCREMEKDTWGSVMVVLSTSPSTDAAIAYGVMTSQILFRG